MREETDRFLKPGLTVSETEVAEWVTQYYQAVFERNQYTSVMNKVLEAANGMWSQVAGLEPFFGMYDRIPIMVPLLGPRDEPQLWCDDETQQLLKEYGVAVDQLYDLFIDSGAKNWSLSQRKRFFALFERFMTSVSYRVARMLTEMNARVSVQKVADPLSCYSTELGLAPYFLKGAGEDGVIW
jgi:hypothetical protein